MREIRIIHLNLKSSRSNFNQNYLYPIRKYHAKTDLPKPQAYLKGEDIGLIKRLIQLHIMISRQKREDARIAALIEEEEEEEGDESRDTRVSLSSDPGTPGSYKYEEPSVDDVEREV